MSTELRYQEHDLGEVMNFFARHFEPTPGLKIIQHEAFIDTAKRTVIFKLLVQKEDSKRPG